MSRKIFDHNPDIDKTAYMNWRMNCRSKELNLSQIGNGCFCAAQCLLQNVLNDNRDKKADIIIFPILFILNQGIEVYLKAIIRLVELFNYGKTNKYATHDILQLFNDMMALIMVDETEPKNLSDFVSPLSSYIEELGSIAADENGKLKMDFARYPFDINGSSFFYITNKNIMVDMEYLLEQVKQIRELLETLYQMRSVRLERKLDT